MRKLIQNWLGIDVLNAHLYDIRNNRLNDLKEIREIKVESLAGSLVPPAARGSVPHADRTVLLNPQLGDRASVVRAR